MDIVLKILKVLNIPLKIIIPTVFVFTSLFLFLSDDILNKLYLYDWKNENGFILGLSFIGSLTLILIFVLYFVIKFAKHIFIIILRKKNIFNSLKKLNDVELSFITYIYNSPNYTARLDYNQPIVKGLLERGYLYTGREQIVYDYGESVILNVMLMPNIIECLNYYIPKMKSEIEKLKENFYKRKNVKKGKKIMKRIETLEYRLKSFTMSKEKNSNQ